jgi:hypothetical protein
MTSLLKKFFGGLDTTPRFPIARSERSPDGHYEVELVARVVIYQDGASGMYIAQCLDLDYMASGESEHDAEQRFILGLNDTIDSYLEEFGSIDKFVRPPSQCATNEFYSAVLSQKTPARKRRLDTTFDNVRMRGALSFLQPAAA